MPERDALHEGPVRLGGLSPDHDRISPPRARRRPDQVGAIGACGSWRWPASPRFSTAPLRNWTYVGLTTAALGLLYLGYILARTLFQGIEVPGYASLICILLLSSGLNMVGLGILGEYLGGIFVEVKRRPLYLVAQTLGFEADGRKQMPAAEAPRVAWSLPGQN